MTTISRLALLATLAILIPACGSGGGGGILGVSNALSILATGGRGSVAGGANIMSFGGNGGDIEIYSKGHLYAGVTPAPEPPGLPTPPSSGFVVTSIAANVVQAGTILLSGTVTTASVSANYSITSTGGDIVISGTLNAGDPGTGKPANLSLNAPNGTVYITGVINAFNADGTLNGDAGGNVQVTAARIVFTGTIDAHGEANATGTGGNGGIVSLDTDSVGGTDILVRGGSMTSAAGATTGPGPTATGGNGAPILLTAGGELQVHGVSLTSSGGAATSGGNNPTGGLAGSIILQGTGGVSFNGSIVAVGGSATGTGTADGSQGGKGGSILVNRGLSTDSGPVRIFGSLDYRGGDSSAVTTIANTGNGEEAGRFEIGDYAGNAPASVDLGGGTWNLTGGQGADNGGYGGGLTLSNVTGPPGSIHCSVSIDCSGGSGGMYPGGGGGVTFETMRGDILVEGPVSARSGNTFGQGNSSLPNKAGGIDFRAGTGAPGSTGSVVVTSTLDVSGGAHSGTGNQEGIDAGSVRLTADNPVGSIALLGTILANGGGGLNDLSGGGGSIRLLTRDERILVAGTITAKGGSTGSGSSGGGGGTVQILSDNDNNDVAGSITIEVGAVIDVSAGRGGFGGWAADYAVMLMADGESSPPGDGVGAGVVVNKGQILATGGDSIDAVVGGRGGGVVFSGCGPGGPATAPVIGTTSVLGGAGTPTGTSGSITTD